MAARYQHCGVVLARSTTDPGDLGIPRHLDPADDGALMGEGRAWLEELWTRGDIRDALALASPSLCERVSDLLADDPKPTRIQDLRRAVQSMASYMVRWQRRVTPFGLFAGILPTVTGPAAAATIGIRHRAVCRVDCEWVAALTASLGQLAGLRPALMVIASNLAFVRDGRLVIPRQAESARPAIPVSAWEASVRWTAPVRAAIEIAATAVLFTDLTAQLAYQFPAVHQGAVTALVNGLVDGGFLVTSLDPPMAADDPLACVIAALRRADSAVVAGLAPRLHALEQVSNQIRACNRCGDPEDSARLRATVAERMRALAPVRRHPLAVDVRLDGNITLPKVVLDEAATAADVLLRLTTRPFGSPAWLDYHARFRERYGPGAVISVRDLVADSGLGFPDGYLGTPRQRPLWRMLTERDAAFLALIQQATLAGSEEIRLSNADVQALTVGDQAAIVPPQRAEIAISLHAHSATAIDRGDFELRVVAVPRAPTSMTGRFAHLLTDAERDQLAATFRADDGSLAVQLSFPPRRPRAANVVRVPPLAVNVLPLGEHSTSGTAAISLDDLAVTADATQMYLVHQPTRLRVVPLIPHALEMTLLTPPLARFIAEVADARTARLCPLDLGAARTLPYVPRIRYRRIILSPARWLLAPGNLSPRPGEAGDRDARLSRWRDRWKVPARVVVYDGERRLPLDLDEALDRALLHRQLEQASQLELREDAPPDDDGWIGRPAELLIPLALTTPTSRPLPVMARPGVTHSPGRSEVLDAQFSGNPARFDDIIGCHLPALMDRIGNQAERWWLRRYRDMIRPDAPQHIAVLIRLRDPSGFAAAAAELASFAADMESRGLPGQLTLATYHEHPARYGNGIAMVAAEQVFAADTAAAIAQISMTAAAGVAGQVLAAASMARIAAAFAPDPGTGYRAMIRCLEQGSGPLDRTLRTHACDLADPTGGFCALRTLPGGGTVAEAWGRRDAALAAYYEELSAQRDPGTVLRTLLHEHHMRALGLDPDFERQTERLARATALRRIALAGRT